MEHWKRKKKERKKKEVKSEENNQTEWNIEKERKKERT